MTFIPSLDRTLLPGSLPWFAVGAVSFLVLLVTSIAQGEIPSAALPVAFVATLATVRGVQVRRRHIERRGIRMLDLDQPG